MRNALRLASIGIMAFAPVGSLFAQEADEFASADQVASKQVSRNYLGGKEDSDLKVQPLLPQPTRYLDGIKPGDENTPSTADANRATD